MNTICLVVDRLHSGYLGPYGNAWIKTPALDRLASQGFVFDQCLIDSPCLNSLYRSYWQGRHALSGPESAPDPSLAAALDEVRTHSVLWTDEPIVARHPLADEFSDVVELPLPEAGQAAAELHETHLARCFARLISQVESLEGPFLLWCHLRGLGGPWDAPWDFRRQYVEPGDPQPPRSTDVPCQMLERGFDPDVLLGISQAYAGQVSLLDACVAALVEYLESAASGRETLLLLTSARGFPLGEHRRIGPCEEALYGELVQVPLIARFPDQRLAAGRSQALVEPADLWATILDWHGLRRPAGPASGQSLLPLMREEVDSLRDRLYVTGPDQRAVRTPAWYLREAKGAEGRGPGGVELFVKPDDRWEVNEVSDRAVPVVEMLRSTMDNYEQVVRGGRDVDLSPLEEVLLAGLE